MNQTAAVIAPPETQQAKLPRQIAYIIGNEGCERFSFYGMRNILTQFLVSSALLFSAAELIPKEERESAAKEVFHTFVLGSTSSRSSEAGSPTGSWASTGRSCT